MRRLSSKATWFWKKCFPAVWLGGIGLFTVVWIPVALLQLQGIPTASLLIPVAMLGMGYFAFRTFCFPLADEVWLADRELIVRNAGREDHVAISEIRVVEATVRTNPERITLRLLSPCAFGSVIEFMPTTRLRFYSRHPIYYELNEMMAAVPDRIGAV